MKTKLVTMFTVFCFIVTPLFAADTTWVQTGENALYNQLLIPEEFTNIQIPQGYTKKIPFKVMPVDGYSLSTTLYNNHGSIDYGFGITYQLDTLPTELIGTTLFLTLNSDTSYSNKYLPLGKNEVVIQATNQGELLGDLKFTVEVVQLSYFNETTINSDTLGKEYLFEASVESNDFELIEDSIIEVSDGWYTFEISMSGGGSIPEYNNATAYFSWNIYEEAADASLMYGRCYYPYEKSQKIAKEKGYYTRKNADKTLITVKAPLYREGLYSFVVQSSDNYVVNRTLYVVYDGNGDTVMTKQSSVYDDTPYSQYFYVGSENKTRILDTLYQNGNKDFSKTISSHQALNMSEIFFKTPDNDILLIDTLSVLLPCEFITVYESSDTVNHITVDTISKSLWVVTGSSNRLYLIDSTGTEKFIRTLDSGDFNISISPNRDAWIATEENVYCYSDSELIAYVGLAGKNVTSFKYDSNNNVIALSSQGNYCYEDPFWIEYTDTTALLLTGTEEFGINGFRESVGVYSSEDDTIKLFTHVDNQVSVEPSFLASVQTKPYRVNVIDKKINISNLNSKSAKLSLISLNGRILHRQNLTLVNGAASLSLPQNIAQGLYVVKVATPNVTLTKKLLIK
jgi:hypothetical protein